MKLLIFGATGRTGLALVSQALDEGHSVTAFARNPKAMNIQHPDLTVVQGDILDYESVDAAMQNQEVVLSALGVNSFKKNTIISDGTQNILKAMCEHHVKRFICVTTMGLGDSKNQKGWAYIMPISLMFRLQRLPILCNQFLDRELQEEYIKNSALDWIIVRPGGLTNGPHTGNYRHGFSIDDTTIKVQISRADVADFMLKQIADDTYLHKTPSLSY
ncbi:NAD(P)-dependent oxidoreductase [Chloroflexota bacterium]